VRKERKTNTKEMISPGIKTIKEIDPRKEIVKEKSKKKGSDKDKEREIDKKKRKKKDKKKDKGRGKDKETGNEKDKDKNNRRGRDRNKGKGKRKERGKNGTIDHATTEINTSLAISMITTENSQPTIKNRISLFL
jgi:hypothetical protein